MRNGSWRSRNKESNNRKRIREKTRKWLGNSKRRIVKEVRIPAKNKRGKVATGAGHFYPR